MFSDRHPPPLWGRTLRTTILPLYWAPEPFWSFQVYSGQISRPGIDPQLCTELKMSHTFYNSSPECVEQLWLLHRLQLCLLYPGDCFKVAPRLTFTSPPAPPTSVRRCNQPTRKRLTISHARNRAELWTSIYFGPRRPSFAPQPCGTMPKSIDRFFLGRILL